MRGECEFFYTHQYGTLTKPVIPSFDCAASQRHPVHHRRAHYFSLGLKVYHLVGMILTPWVGGFMLWPEPMHNAQCFSRQTNKYGYWYERRHLKSIWII